MTARYHEIPAGAIRIAVPEVRQKTDWSCGAAALQAVAGYFGVGPEEEADFARDMRIDHRVGAHPFEIRNAAHLYGLAVDERQNMTLEDLTDLINQQKPVLLMIQAWGDPDKYQRDEDYQGVWKEGHWVVAIGHDEHGFFFEDPSLAVVRGYLSREGLLKRWRDTGPHGRHMWRVGLAIWRAGDARPTYPARARYID